MKILYFDCETTGRDPIKNDIVQISGIVEIDGIVKNTFNYKMQPADYANIEPEALAVTGYTVEEMKTWQHPQLAFKSLLGVFNRFINKYDKNDKFTPAGYNVRFDLDFLQSFFKKNGEMYGCGSYQNWKAIDGLPLMHFLEGIGAISLPNYKLSTVCEHYGIAIKAHDAMSDITATRELLLLLKKKIGDGLLAIDGPSDTIL